MSAYREGVEDLTGGISTTILSSDILSKDRFWTEGLRQVNKEFLFGCGTDDWDDPSPHGRDGIHGGHAYSVLRAENYGQERLLMVKNPWAHSEWNGPWSDGSSQWTAESIKELGHTFGDDGVFWIRYEDLLRKFSVIWRTRLFSVDWQVTQQWMMLAVPWAGDYQDAKFRIVISKKTSTVIVLSQLDDRYFRGLKGQYDFQLSFRLHEAGQEDYIIRTQGSYYDQRSVSVELELEAGEYEVRLKISALRNRDADKVEDVVRTNWLARREKLLEIGLSYDLAHAKGQFVGNEEEKKSEPTAKTEVDIEPGSDATNSAVKAAPPDNLSPGTGDTEAAPEKHDNGPEKHENEPEKHDKDPEKPNKEPEKEKAETNPDEIPDKPAEDPWGAVCVVGLRVYCRGADATVEIVRSTKPVTEKPKLDIDDPARDATKSTGLPNGTKA